MRGAKELCLAAIVITMMLSWYAVNLSPEVMVRGDSQLGGGTLAQRLRSRRAHGQPGAAAPAADASRAVAAAPTALASVPSPTASGECPPGRRPYHVIMTAASGTYQEWQSRIAYYHYQKQKRLHPCSEMGGFTRLVNLPGGKPDALVAEMPTVVVKQLDQGRREGGDYGFIVMNRPWGVLQLFQTERWKAIEEEYVLIMETDHLIMHPPANKATPSQPHAFKFYYMNSKDPQLQPIIRKYWDGPFEQVDPVGPSPAIMTKAMLEKITPAWWDFSLRMKRDDPDANRHFGWVLEMWGYTLGVLSLGVRHVVDPEFQCEPQGTGLDGMVNYPIYHYTFDLRYENVWSVSKRQYHGRYFPRNYRMPPPCSAESHTTFISLLNEATANLPGYQGQDAGGDSKPWPEPATHWLNDYTRARAPGTPAPSPVPRTPPPGRAALTHAVAGTGPWTFGDAHHVFFFARGVLTVYGRQVGAVKGGTGQSGTWRFARAEDEATGGGDGSAGQAAPLVVDFCGTELLVSFDLQPGRWALTGSPVAGAQGPSVRGELRAQTPKHARHADEAVGYPEGSVAAQVAGTGPYAWAGMVTGGFLRGGAFHSPWAMGTWEHSPNDPSKVVVTFYGIKHDVHEGSKECGRFLSTRVHDRDRVPVAFSANEPACRHM